MEDGESSIIRSSDFISNHKEEEEAAAAADNLRRNKQVEEELQNEFAGLDDDDDDDDDDEDSSEESTDNSFQNSKDEHLSTEAPFGHQEQTLPPGESCSLSRIDDNPTRYYHKNDSEDEGSSHIYNNHRPRRDDSSSPTHSSLSVDHLATHTQVNDSEVNHFSDNDASNIFNNHSPREESEDEDVSQFHHNADDNERQFEHSDVASKGRAKYGKKSYLLESPTANSYPTKSALNEPDWEEECRKLNVLFRSRGEELKRVQNENIRSRKEIELLNGTLSVIKGEKEKFFFLLQESDKSLSKCRKENNVLSGKLAATEVQLSAENAAKEDALSKLQSAEITIQSLEQKMKALSRSDDAVRQRDQNERIFEDLKLRHQKEVLLLKEEIDKLQESLNCKILENENMKSDISLLQSKCEELQLEKTEQFNRLSVNLEASQNQIKNLLESGTIQENGLLKLEIQQLREEKSKQDKCISTLKEEVKSLQNELQTSEALRKLEVEDENKSTQATNDRRSSSSQKERGLKAELQKSLKDLQSVRSLNRSLKEKLDELNRQLPLLEERAKLYESRYKESESKLKELEKKLAEVLPHGSVPAVEHHSQVAVLQNEVTELKKKLRDVSGKLKKSASNEEKLSKNNKNLRSQISEMLESHASEKIQAVEECREKCLEIHESAIKKIKDELTSKAETELNHIRSEYDNKIAVLEKEIKVLNDDLFDSKNQYVKISQENKLLHSKLDSLSKPKERAEIEKEVCSEYEQKLNELKKQEQEYNNYKIQIESNIENFKKNWAQQKMVEIEEYTNNIKKQLDERFNECLEKELSDMKEEKEKILKECQEKIYNLKQQFEAEKNKLQVDYQQKVNDIEQRFEAEKDTLHHECKVKINNFKQLSETEKEEIIADYRRRIDAIREQSDAEKDDLNTRLRESFELKWKNEHKELDQSHRMELNSMKQKYENTMSKMNAEMNSLKDRLQRRAEESEVVQSLQVELANQRQAWEAERKEFIENERTINAKLSDALELQNKLKEKVKKYYKYVSSIKKKYLEKTKEFRIENEKLKKLIADKDTQFLTIKEQYELKVLEQEEDIKKQFRNSYCQTEEKLFSESTLVKIHAMFIESLKKIADEMKNYVQDSRKRSSDQLKKALNLYRDGLIQTIFRDQDIFKQNFLNLHSNVNIHSGSSSRDRLVSNSSSTDNLTYHNAQTRNPSVPSDLNCANVLKNARSTPDSGNRFGDVSFDYVPIKIPDSALTSTKIPEYFVPTGLFSRQNIFPERDSPFSIVN